MSLKGFHIVLISLSSLLTLGFAAWSVVAWRAGRGAGYLGLAGLSCALAAALAVYVVWFARSVRTRDEEDRRRRKLIHPLGLGVAAWLLSLRPAAACSVCYGEADGPLIDAARMGVWLLFGLVFAVQLCFGLFFIQLGRRARRRGVPGAAAAGALAEPRAPEESR